MGRQEVNIHYIYKTTCVVTGRYYIGMHSTSNLNDGYLGSGKRLRYSIRKYGKGNHIKEILGFYESRMLLIEAEIQLITSKLIQDKNCMNLKEGGTGGFANEEHRIKAITAGGKAYSLKLETDPVFKALVIKRMRENTAKRNNNYQGSLFKDKKHSDESKKLMSESSKGMGLREKNSQYGTCWITNGIENRKLNKEADIPEGWYKGRK